MDKNLELANCIHPDTYEYNTGKAYVLVCLYKDGQAAKKCVEKCKEINQNNDWQYSEAFLCAYMGKSAGIVMSKYMKAFTKPYENPVELLDYIEFVLEQEPDKVTLHLAAGILYSKTGDSRLSRQHLSIYLEKVSNIDRRTLEKIDRLMRETDCGIECNKNCSSCSSLGAA